MRSNTPKISLGLALGPDRAYVAEVRRARGGDVVTRQAVLPLTPGADLDSPAGLGAALSALLKAEGFKANHVAIGLCSRWVLASPRTMPPLQDEALVSAVRLQIERDYAGGRDDLVFDFTEPTPPNGQRKLVLMGTQRKRLQQAIQAALAAGLRVTYAMPTALAVAVGAGTDGGTGATGPGAEAPSARGEPQSLCIALEDDGAALVHLKGGRCHGLTSIPFDPAALDDDAAAGPAPWAQALARSADALGVGSASPILINSAQLNDAQLQQARAALTPAMGTMTAAAANPAAAVATAALRRSVGVNFTRPRLMQKAKRSLPSAVQWAIRAAVFLLLIVAAVGYLWFEAQNELTQLQDDYAAIKDQADRLAQVQADTSAMAGWYDDRPPVLDCLLELTRTFPRSGRIWVTALTLDEDAAGTLNCKAADERTMYQYLNAMKASPHLADVQLQVRQTTDREGQTVRFDVTFRYEPDAPAVAGSKPQPASNADVAASDSGAHSAANSAALTPGALTSGGEG